MLPSMYDLIDDIAKKLGVSSFAILCYLLVATDEKREKLLENYNAEV